MTHIRFATPDDAATLLALVKGLADYEREPDAVVATVPMLAAALGGEHPAAEALIAEADGEPVGFALFFHTFSTWTGTRGLYLEDLYVVPSARGTGLGKALLSRLAGIAIDRGCARFEWQVLDWNTPAIEFYRAQGATMMDEWRGCRVDGAALVRLAGR